MKPSASTIASVGIGVPCATILSWVISQITGNPMPGPVEAALGAVISAVIGYIFPGGQSQDLQPKAQS